MRVRYTFLALFIVFQTQAQTGMIRGSLQNAAGDPLGFANVALYRAADSSLAKVAISEDDGRFELPSLDGGAYRLEASYLGLPSYREAITLEPGQVLDLGVRTFGESAVELEEAIVRAARPLVEIKPDRTIFNVQGTINSTGEDALSLLRKAPGVLVDNNDQLSVLGRSGVLLYVDGKQLPLRGNELAQYLSALQADQIDHIAIISNPGARYDAAGNAGIIDIRLKKDKNHGANGSINTSFSQGRYFRANTGASGNYRNKHLNVFGNGAVFRNRGFNTIDFLNVQNGLSLDEINRMYNRGEGFEVRAGLDYFLSDHHTVGVLASAGEFGSERRSLNRVRIASLASPTLPDSILLASTRGDDSRQRLTANLNYRYDNRKGRTLNLDADLGQFANTNVRFQPNRYYAADGSTPLSEVINAFDTPTDIAIYTLKADYEQDLLGGKWSAGAKYSQVVSDNTFLVYDVPAELYELNRRLSNTFDYDERVMAGYLQYGRSLGKTWQMNAGLRGEHTTARGDLQAFLPELQEPPVNLHYFNLFPTAGLSWQPMDGHALNLQYGRRINRPDYHVLNPFNNLLSQLSYEKGNPFLRPEIVHNLELGYTLLQRYNLKVAYSRTLDQITRLIGPDAQDPRANFISWENLARQTVWSANLSAPIQLAAFWSAYVNINASHLHNQADYGQGATVDLQAFTYNLYHQQSFQLPYGLKAEISGWYSGPGIWGGVFRYDPSWSLDLGLQRRFLREKLNVRLNVTDIFYEAYWSGVSAFNGLEARGQGQWDSRRCSISLSYDMGNQKVRSRRRNTGLEEEAKRLGGNG